MCTAAVSNADPFDFSDADSIAAPIIEAGSLRIGMASHALRDLDTTAVAEIVRNAGGAEGVVSYRRLDSCIFATPATIAQASLRDIGRSLSFCVLPSPERNSGPLRSFSMPVAWIYSSR